MSVEGSLLTDLRQLRSQPAFLTIAVTGPKGCGKTFTLAQFIKGWTGTGHAVVVHSLKECFSTSTVSNGEDGAAVISPPPILSVSPSTLREESIAVDAVCVRGDTGSGGEASLRPGTVLLMDDIEALWALAVMNSTSHLLQRTFLLAQRSTSCRVIFSANDENSIPYFFRKGGRPLLYAMPSLTSVAVRRTVRAIAAAAPAFSTFENCGDALTPPCTRRNLVLAMTMAAASLPSTVIPNFGASSIENHVRFLQGDTDAAAATTASTSTLFGLENVLSRLELLVSVFATGAVGTGAGGGQLLRSLKSTTGVLLHGPSGCGKSAAVREVARRHPHVMFTFVQCTALFSKYLGESEEKLRDVYRAARAAAPSVVVLDEVDVLAQSRQGGAEGGTGDGGRSAVSVTRRMLACLLCELDGIADNSGVLTIATTNAPHVLDSALLRQGRLETMLAVPPLSYAAALAMSEAFFSTFEPAATAPSPNEDREAPQAAATACMPPSPSLTEKVAQAGAGCAPTNLHYLLRKILERHLTSLPDVAVSSAPPSSTVLPMPSAETVHACLFECAPVLTHRPYVDPFAS